MPFGNIKIMDQPEQKAEGFARWSLPLLEQAVTTCCVSPEAVFPPAPPPQQEVWVSPACLALAGPHQVVSPELVMIGCHPESGSMTGTLGEGAGQRGLSAQPAQPLSPP